MKTKNKKIISSVIIFIIVAFIVFTVYFLIVKYFYPNILDRGSFGEMFGGLNTFFSILAFLGLVYTIILQREDLNLQRKELKLTREELKRTAEAQEKSEQSLSKQAESLKITAKLNGKSAILQHYNTLIEMTNSARYGINTTEFEARKRDANLIINDINSLIENK